MGSRAGVDDEIPAQLVPLDGSELSKTVLDHVVIIVKSCRVPEVILARVREPLDNSIRVGLDPEIAKELD